MLRRRRGRRLGPLAGVLAAAAVVLVAASTLAGQGGGVWEASAAAHSGGSDGPETSVAWDRRDELVLGTQDALTALDALPADSPAAVSWSEGGSRTGWFGQAWTDVDGDGCDTRNEILARDLESPDFSRAPGTQGPEEGRGQGAASCPDATVWSGTLNDPYTGAQIAFQRGQDTSSAVQIDHVVPLNYLYAHGAWAWDDRTRLLVANDPLNLLAVDGPANQEKGACGPATCPVGSTETGSWVTSADGGWWPQPGYRCEYARRFVSVASTYALGLPEEDRDSLRATLTDCAAGGDGAPSVVERVIASARDTGSAIWSSPWYSALLAAGAAALGWGLVTAGARRGRGRYLRTLTRSLTRTLAGPPGRTRRRRRRRRRWR